MENLDLIDLIKGIKGLFLRHDDTGYFYIRMRSALQGFLNMQEVGMTIT